MQMGPSVQEDKKAHSLDGIRQQDWGEEKKISAEQEEGRWRERKKGQP
jgi:hypothetical protein